MHLDGRVEKIQIGDPLIKKGRGIDRIVLIGSTIEFSVIWDGYNLVEEMTRRIVIR